MRQKWRKKNVSRENDNRKRNEWKRKKQQKRDSQCPAVWYDVEMYAKENFILFVNIRWLSLQWNQMKLSVQYYGGSDWIDATKRNKRRWINTIRRHKHTNTANNVAAQRQLIQKQSACAIDETRQDKRRKKRHNQHIKLNRSYYGNLLKFMLRTSCCTRTFDAYIRELRPIHATNNIHTK